MVSELHLCAQPLQQRIVFGAYQMVFMASGFICVCWSLKLVGAVNAGRCHTPDQDISVFLISLLQRVASLCNLESQRTVSRYNMSDFPFRYSMAR